MKFKKIILAVFATGLTVGCGQPSTDSQVADFVGDQAEEELDWVERTEDRETIEMLARSGSPRVAIDSDRCGGEFKDYLGRDSQGDVVCVNQWALPSNVLEEVKIGNQHRFKNASDYDKRVTRLYVYEHNGELNRFLDSDDIAMLARAFDIPTGTNQLQAQPNIFTRDDGDIAYFQSLNSGMYVGNDYVAETLTYEYAVEVLHGEPMKTMEWKTEVVLYPGGGFTTSYEVIVQENMLIFIKIEGWNS
jgi:hypothetical protein